MSRLRIKDFLTDAILVSRESARLLDGPLRASLAAGKVQGRISAASPVIIDLAQVQGISPSFIQELLLLFESLTESCGDRFEQSLIIANPPTDLSSKFEAVARGHQLTVQALADGSWLFAKKPNAECG